MDLNDPKLIYMTLILPGIFGVSMVREGVVKITHYQDSGWWLVIAGIMFMVTIGLTYVFITGIL